MDPIGNHDTLLCFLGFLVYLIGGKLELTLKNVPYIYQNAFVQALIK
jgi:hypothetical protein